MKILGVLFFLVAMIWTWKVIHTEPSISFETHAGIQENMARLVLEQVQAKRPTATDIKINNVWTEILSEKTVKAHFSYSFKDKSAEGATTENQIQGEGLLERQAVDEKGMDHWTLKEVKTNSDAIVFSEALFVTPGAAEATPSAPTETK